MKTDKLYLYWIDSDTVRSTRDLLKQAGFRIGNAHLTPCQTMHADGDKVIFAGPGVWNRICVRQSSWYRDSDKGDRTMLVSARRLPAPLDPHLEAEILASDFQPDDLPSGRELQEIVESSEYKDQRPDDCEKIGLKDSLMFKMLFTITGFWGLDDNLKRHWLGHRANHANFLTKTKTVEIDGEDVAYSVTDNDGVCSSCAEFFNVISPDDRKLVRACPGAVTFGGAPRERFLEVRPTQIGSTSTAAC